MEDSKKYKWYKIAESDDELVFGRNGLLQINIGGKDICLTKLKDALYGCSAKCPHAGGVIAEGFIDDFNNIVCPLHSYKFNLVNGRNVSGEGYHLKTYPVNQREDGVYVGIEVDSFPNGYKYELL